MKMSEQRNDILATSNEKEHSESSPSSLFNAGASDAPPVGLAGSGPPADRDAAWSEDAIGMAVVIPVVIAIIVGGLLRNFCIARRLYAEALDLRRERLEWRGRIEEARRERANEVEAALVTKTASKCNCSPDQGSDMTKCFSTSEITMRTNATNDTSACSSEHDVENTAAAHDETDDESSSGQICAICLEPYVAGKDRVSWSRFQTCRHAFHDKCIRGWLEHTKNAGNCPCCRGTFLREEEPGPSKEIEATPNEESDRSGETNADEESQRNVNAVRTEQGRDAAGGRFDADVMPDGECDEEETPGDSNAQTQDKRVPVAGSGIVMSALHENSPLTNVEIGSEFTSFCVFHGLIRDTECGNKCLSIKHANEPTALGGGVQYAGF